MAPGIRSTTKQDRAVRSYVRRELHAHVPAVREQLGGTQFDAKGLRTTADLTAVPPTDLAELSDTGDHLVQPTREQLLRASGPLMRLRTAWASSWGSWPRFMGVIEPSYRPVHYFTADGVAIGASAKDLVRLAGLGAEWMRALRLHAGDSVGLLEGARSAIEPWQLSGGTRRAGIPLAVIEDPVDARNAGVSVVAGRPAAVADALRGGGWPGLRLAIVFGPDATAVEKVAPSEVDVRRAWAVPGARSVWFECVRGPGVGWHTDESAELLEVGDDDEALWTGLGWAGTVFLRLRTNVRVDSIDTTLCPGCTHRSPRLFTGEGSPALARWLRNEPRVAEFRLTAAGADVLPVRAGANARLVSEARKAFPELVVTVKTKRGWQA